MDLIPGLIKFLSESITLNSGIFVGKVKRGLQEAIKSAVLCLQDSCKES